MASRGWFSLRMQMPVALAALFAVAGCQSSMVLPPPGHGEKPPMLQEPGIAEEQGATSSSLAPAPARIAMLLPLSGVNAEIGRSLRNAAEMALFDSASPQLALQFYDTAGTAEGARRAVLQAASQQAALVLGPVTTIETQAALGKIQDSPLRLISFSTDARLAQRGAYVFGFLPREQAKAVVAHAYQAGARRFAVLAPQNAYGLLMSEACANAVRSLEGASVTRSLTYGQGDAIEEKIRLLTQQTSSSAPDPLPFDALFLPEAGSKLQEILPLLTRYGVNQTSARLLGPLLWNAPSIALNPAMTGAWFPASPPRDLKAFQARYRSIYETEPADIASLAYDLTAMAAVLTRLYPQAPFTDQAITSQSGFIGVDGLFRFLADRTSERAFSIMEINAQGPIETAPGAIVFPAQDSFFSNASINKKEND